MEINLDNIPLPGGSAPIDYFNKLSKVTKDIDNFIKKSVVKAEDKAFAPGTVFKAFEEYLNSQGKKLQEMSKFKKLIGKEDPVKGVKKSLNELANAAQEYKDVASLYSYEVYSKKGKTALYVFLNMAEEAGVESKELMESFAVIGALSGFDIDLSKVKQSDFRAQKDEDFKMSAQKIIKRSVTLPEISVVSKYKNEMDDAEAFEYAAEAEMSRTGFGKGVNNKKVTLSSSIDNIDYDYAKEKIEGSLEKVGENANFKKSLNKKRNA